jgi:rRNA maturation RNase YbeY
VIRFFEESSYQLPDKRSLREWIEDILVSHDQTVQFLNIILVDDDRISELNETHLKHTGPTDVITFPYSKPAEPIEAEIYISTETVARNAKQFKTPVDDELRRVMIHGVLHLCGFPDKTDAQRKQMKKLEDQALARRGGK